MSYQIIVPKLQIGEFIVESPVGFSKLLESSWSKPKADDGVLDLSSKYNRTVFRNEEGRIVTRYSPKGGEDE